MGEEAVTEELGQDEGYSEQEPSVETEHSEGQADSGELQEGDSRDWEYRYKEVQSAFTRSQQELKDMQERLNQFGGLDAVQKAVEMASNPKLQEMLSEQQTNDAYMELLGVNESDMTPEQRDAVKLVEKLADRIASKKAEEMIQKNVAPYVNAQKDAHVKGLLSKMDEKYPEWRSVKDDMGKLATSLAPGVLDNPSMEIIEGLYLSALASKGQLEDMMAKTYESRLKAKQAKSTPKPSGDFAGPNGKPNGKANSVQEAYEQAKRTLNL